MWKKIKKKYYVKSFFSLEVICIITTLGFFIHKIIKIAYTAINNFYLFNSILLIVNNCIYNNTIVNTKIQNITITNDDKIIKITINTDNKQKLESVKNYLTKHLTNQNIHMENNILTISYEQEESINF